ncbi:MAG: hypothetical protein R2762_10515 [Bryobacteraceae bacterium]
MIRLTTCLLIALLLSASVSAGSLDSVSYHPPKQRSRFWRASVLSILAASALDTHSSFHRYEGNPLLRGPDGRFRYRGFAIKAAITGGALGAQYYLLRRGPKAEKASAFVNFGISGMLAGVAATNYRNPSKDSPAQRSWGGGSFAASRSPRPVPAR